MINRLHLHGIEGAIIGRFPHEDEQLTQGYVSVGPACQCEGEGDAGWVASAAAGLLGSARLAFPFFLF